MKEIIPATNENILSAYGNCIEKLDKELAEICFYRVTEDIDDSVKYVHKILDAGCGVITKDTVEDKLVRMLEEDAKHEVEDSLGEEFWKTFKNGLGDAFVEVHRVDNWLEE